MSRTLTIALALLLAVSTPAIALDAPTPTASSGSSAGTTTAPIEPGNGTAARMVFPSGADVTSTFVTPSLDLGGSVGMRHDGLQNEFNAYYLGQMMAEANTSTEKRQFLFQFTYRVENRIAELKETNRVARRSYANGTLSTTEYLRTVGRTDAEAERIKSLLDRVAYYSARTDGSNLDSRVETLKLRLAPVEGPVRDRIARTLQGDASGVRVHVAVADSGVMLSMLVDGDRAGAVDATYVREAYRSDIRNPNKTVRLSPEEGQRIARELYPWANNRTNFRSLRLRSPSAANLYQISLTHDHGELTAYVDGSSERVYREAQRKPLSQIPLTESVRNTENGTTVVANRTYPGGPLQVTLFDSATNETVNGVVAIDGERIGTTGEDGTLWTIEPRGTYTVEGTTSFNTANLTVRSSAPTKTPSEG